MDEIVAEENNSLLPARRLTVGFSPLNLGTHFDDADSNESDERDSLISKIKDKLTFNNSASESSEEEEDTLNSLPAFWRKISRCRSNSVAEIQVDGDCATTPTADDISQRSANTRSSISSVLAKGRQYLRKGRRRSLKKHSKNKPFFSPTGYWITDTFRKRDCRRFVPNTQNIEYCKCGLHRAEHQLTIGKRKNTSSLWNYKYDTVLGYTDAFGQIDFVASHLDTLPNYVRVDIKTPPEDILQLLIEKWGLRVPNLVISIFGDSFSDLKMDPHNCFPIDDLKLGILKAAETTNAWFFTSGLKCGVGNLIGRAVGEKRSFINPIPTIGLAPWGGVANRMCLIDPRGAFPALYTPAQSKVILNKWTTKIEVPLEPNHTHFLLFDKGMYNTFFKTDLSKTRIELEKLIRSPEVLKTSEIVGIMIGGDLSSLKEARARVEAGIPVIIMEGTGKMSDVICNAFNFRNKKFKGPSNLRQSWHGDQLSSEAIQSSIDLLKEFWPIYGDGKFEKQVSDLMFLYRNQQHITICNLSHHRIDHVILAGLIRSIEWDERNVDENSKNIYLQLRLAITWNRPDLVMDEILKNMVIQDVLSVYELNDLLYHSIELNRPEFVEYFLKCGVSVSSFLDSNRVAQLLNSVKRGTVLYRLLKEQKKTKSVKDSVVRKVSNCMGIKKPRKQKFRFHHFHRMIYKISDGVYKCVLVNKRESTMHDLDSSLISRMSVSSSSFEDPYIVLVLFCALQQKHLIAKIFWECSRTPTMLALIASHVYYWLASKESSYIEITPEMKPLLKQYGDEFQNFAYRIIDEASKNYSVLWVESLLTHTYYRFGGRDLLQVADYIGAYHFISHAAIQDYITRIWMGMLEPDMKYWKIFLTLPFPFFASFRKRTVNDLSNSEAIQEGDEFEMRKMTFIGEKGNLDNETDVKQPLTIPEKIILYYSAPVVKFFVYLLLYAGFLLFYCNALLIKPEDNDEIMNLPKPPSEYDLPPQGPRMTLDELIVYVWVLSIIPVEIRQIHHMCPSTVSGKLKNYMSTVHNKIDVASLMFIILALFFKYVNLHIVDELEDYGISSPQFKEIFMNSQLSIKFEETMFRFFFTLAFCGLCLRLMQAMQIHPKLGPKVLMMLSMFVDLMFFVGLLVMALFCYGVATQSLIYPDKNELTFNLVFSVLWRPYVNMFGELDLDGLVGDINEGYCAYNKRHNRSVSCTNARTTYNCLDDSYCYANKIVILIFLGVYMMLVAVMMLNLLVAVFTFTYEQINSNSDKIWKYQRFDLVHEFKMRTAFPVPFNTIILFFLFLRWFYRKTVGRRGDEARRRAVKMKDIHRSDKIALLEAECKRNVLDKLREESDLTLIRSNVIKCCEDINHLHSCFDGFQKSIQTVLDNSYNADQNCIKEDEVPEVIPDIGKVENVNEPNLEERTYPGTTIKRFHVAAGNRSWSKVLIDYDPPFYTDNSMTESIEDNDAYNEGEKKSFIKEYEVRDGVPLNPLGRTGIRGKGSLKRWGPNHKFIPCISRQCNDRFEVLLSYNNDTFNLPVFDTTYSKPIDALMRDICHGEVDRLSGDILSPIFLDKFVVDEPKNTDNAWSEVISFSFHNSNLTLKDTQYEWSPMSEDICNIQFYEIISKSRRLYDRTVYMT